LKTLVLSGGSDQIALIKELKKRNNEVVLVDYFENPPAKGYADKHIKASTLDLDNVLEIAKKEDVGLVITACTDQALLTMSYVSEKLGLNCYLSYEQARNFTNKLYMKEHMKNSGIPTSKYVILGSSDVCQPSAVGLDYPLVVKPVDNNSSKGISKVNNQDELNIALRDAKQYSRSRNVIFEQYNHGDEYSIDAFIHNGEPIIIITTKYKKITSRNKFTITQSSYPCELSSAIIEKIKKIITNIGQVFKVDNTPLFMQLLIENEEVNVVEFSARTGGGSKLHFIRELTGLDIIQNLLDLTFNIPLNLNMTYKKKHAAICFIYAKAGVFHGIENAEQLKQQSIIHDYYYYKTYGMTITDSGYSSDRPAGFFVLADSEEELAEKICFVDNNIKVLNEKGDDIMLHGVYN